MSCNSALEMAPYKTLCAHKEGRLCGAMHRSLHASVATLYGVMRGRRQHRQTYRRRILESA